MAYEKGMVITKTRKAVREVRKILDSLDGDKITIRFLLYKLISAGTTFIRNTKKGYPALLHLVNRARIRQDQYDKATENGGTWKRWSDDGDVYGLPDDCFIDNKREIRHSNGHADVNAFVTKVRGWYDRDIWQDQDTAVFLLVEKATVGDVIEPITLKYQVPLAVSTGYFGRTFMHQIAEQIRETLRNGKRVYIGYIGDHDPSGMDVEKSLQEGNDEDGCRCSEGLRQIMGKIGEIDWFDCCMWERIAITELEFEYHLPDSVKVSIKELETDENGKKRKGDTRSPAYKEKYKTDMGAEVEALDTQVLRDRVEEWIRKHMDTDKYEQCLATQETERELLASLEL